MTTPAGSETRCRSCGKKIVFGKLGNGKFIPLDLVAPVYALNDDGTAIRATEEQALPGRIVGFYVSHFTTCAFASQHSKSKKPAAPEGQP